jgi:hypothetical protein
MICGNLGFIGRNGQPCGQSINATTKEPCIWHKSTPEERKAVSQLGTMASKMKKALPDLTIGDLTQDEGILQTLSALLKAAASQPVELRRVSEIRQGLGVAVSLRQAAATRELNRTLMRLEHGEHAVILLEQLRANRTLRPLPPGRSLKETASGE